MTLLLHSSLGCPIVAGTLLLFRVRGWTHHLVQTVICFSIQCCPRNTETIKDEERTFHLLKLLCSFPFPFSSLGTLSAVHISDLNVKTCKNSPLPCYILSLHLIHSKKKSKLKSD